MNIFNAITRSKFRSLLFLMAEEGKYFKIKVAQNRRRENMLSIKKTLACFDIFIWMILINFSAPAFADFDQNADKTIETRLHKIYVEHYSRKVVESDWLKIVDAIQEQVYSVKKGDTLWGISSIYFGDGNYWSKLWSVNKSITNPHLILVGDRIHFKAGFYNSAPSVTVEPGAEGEAVEMAPMSDSEEGAMPVASSRNSDFNANLLPASFKPLPPVKPMRVGKVSVETRSELRIASYIKMTQEIVRRRPKVIATVRSVGGDRLATGESNRIVIDRRGEYLNVGTIATVLDPDFSDTKRGYWIKVLGRVKILKAIDRHLYEAEVIEQFDAITVNSAISDYEIKTVDLTPTGEPITTDVNVIKVASKTFWSNGDFIFLSVDQNNLNVGDMLTINNKFAPNLDFYYHVGLVKVVSVNPPFATGVVLSSNTVIREDSVSAK